MAHGKVDVRVNEKTGKARLRFYSVAPDQLELILTALEHIRKEVGTIHDTVALELMALGYLSSLPVAAAPPSAPG